MSWFFKRSNPPHSDALNWQSEVASAGGTLEVDSFTIANNLVTAMSERSYFDKLLYLAPFLGADINAARVPLIKRVAFGAYAMTNNGFVDGDFDQSTGVTGDGTSYFSANFPCGNLWDHAAKGGDGRAFGFGWYLNGFVSGGNYEVMGAAGIGGNDTRFILNFQAGSEGLMAGFPLNGNSYVSRLNAPTDGNYYGQRKETNERKLFKDGVLIATSTTAGATLNSPDPNIELFATFYANGSTRSVVNDGCFCAYMTDGDLTDAEVDELNDDLDTYLIIPTGR